VLQGVGYEKKETVAIYIRTQIIIIEYGYVTIPQRVFKKIRVCTGTYAPDPRKE